MEGKVQRSKVRVRKSGVAIRGDRVSFIEFSWLVLQVHLHLTHMVTVRLTSALTNRIRVVTYTSLELPSTSHTSHIDCARIWELSEPSSSAQAVRVSPVLLSWQTVPNHRAGRMVRFSLAQLEWLAGPTISWARRGQAVRPTTNFIVVFFSWFLICFSAAPGRAVWNS